MLPLIFVCIFWSCGVNGFINVYPNLKQYPIEGNPGQPLYLTPLIEKGEIKRAQNMARVGPLEGVSNIRSYSGYLTVNKEFNSNLFFWFFPAMYNYEVAPVVLWLQGGPGATSLFGLFTEHGPFYVDKKMSLKARKYSWTKSHSVLYIDNPVGTGFSFTENELGYSTNETAVGHNLYLALLQFFELFPNLSRNDFYVTGESYAGKYVPAISYTIHQENPKAALKINLKGLAIGNGFCDPEHMLNYSSYLFQIGLIDSHARDFFRAKEAEGVRLIQEKKFNEVFKIFDELLDGDLTPYPSYFNNVTGFTFYFNFLHAHNESEFGDFGKFVQKSEIRNAIHVGSRPFNEGTVVEKHLQQDVMQSVKPWVEALLDSGMYRVLIYNGQLDVIVAYPLTVSFMDSLKWSGTDVYANATRHIWHVNGKIAGFSKVAGPLTEVLVRNAGHMVPTDQPKWALDLLNRFTANKPFTS